jgi:outer membrane protein OmpA-like peptidoglycan-associated protein
MEPEMAWMARVLVPATVFALASGCATRDWVERELERREARLDRTISTTQGSTTQAQQDVDLTRQGLTAVDQRVKALEARSAALETQSAGLDARSTQLDARVQDASNRATEASARATEASARAESTDARLTRLWATRNVRTVVNILQVEFAFDQYSLDDSAKSMLFALVRELRESPDLAIDLEGYTDAKGSYFYNVRLSQRRVDAVRRYLIDQGVEEHRIRAAARGPAADATTPEGRMRRVDIKLIVAAD